MIVPIIAAMVEALAGAPLPKLNCPQMPHMVESFGVLDRLVNDKPGRQKTLSHCLVEIAWFSDYLTRACDPPPGNTLCSAGYHADRHCAGHNYRRTNLSVIASFTGWIHGDLR
ncbi:MULTISPECIES: hypothetical protein [unclassified Bradyrhizobium]